MRIEPLRDARRLAMIAIAALVSAFNIRSFVNSAGLFPGGFSGLTLLIQKIFETYIGVRLPYTLVNLLLNAVPVLISFRFIGKKFTLLSCAYLVLSSVLVDVIPGMSFTDNSLLCSIFGGIIGGFAIALCLNADATSGGTDFISIFMSERHGIDTFNYILMGNVAMLCVAGLLFGWERALYSIIYQYASTQVIHALFTRYQKQTLFIVTEQPEKIYNIIRDNTVQGRGTLPAKRAHHGVFCGFPFRGSGGSKQGQRGGPGGLCQFHSHAVAYGSILSTSQRLMQHKGF